MLSGERFSWTELHYKPVEYAQQVADFARLEMAVSMPDTEQSAVFQFNDLNAALLADEVIPLVESSCVFYAPASQSVDAVKPETAMEAQPLILPATDDRQKVSCDTRQMERVGVQRLQRIID